MRVKDLMQKAVFTIGPEDPIDKIFPLLHFERIRHLPVIDGTRVIGIVSDRDLYKALGPRSPKGPAGGGATRTADTAWMLIPRKVRHIMHRGVITIVPEATLAEAAEVMAAKRIGALPVVKDSKLVGIITATDLLKAFVTVYHKAFPKT